MDHYQLIGWCLGLAARRAATVIKGETLDRLRDLLDQLNCGVIRRSRRGSTNEFHRTINRVVVVGVCGRSAVVYQSMPRHSSTLRRLVGDGSLAHENIFTAPEEW